MVKLPVVYTMGKVSSWSVAEAIGRAGRRCHAIHTLNPEYLHKIAQRFIARGDYPANHVCVSMAWDWEIKDTRRCLYISLVRDPIARNLSSYFHSLAATAEPNLESFCKSFPHGVPAAWFDAELKGFLGIDVYDVPFNKACRSVVTDQFLLMRTDLDDAEKSSLLSRALGSEISIERKNVGASKSYSRAYQSIQDTAKFPPDFLNKMYSTKFARHFWTDDELEAFRCRWSA